MYPLPPHVAPLSPDLMSLHAATDSNSSMSSQSLHSMLYLLLTLYLSNLPFRQLTLGACTISSGNMFQIFTILCSLSSVVSGYSLLSAFPSFHTVAADLYYQCHKLHADTCKLL